MSVNLRVVAENWGSILLAVLGVLLVKAAVTAGLLWLGGARKAVAAEPGVLMASPSETTLIVLTAASAAQLITLDGRLLADRHRHRPHHHAAPAQLGRVAARRVDMKADIDLPVIGTGDEAPAAVIIGFAGSGGWCGNAIDAWPQLCRGRFQHRHRSADCRREGFPIIFGDVARPELVDRLNLAMRAPSSSRWTIRCDRAAY
jgi:CPA2 family monovalent cation:H+ antiporter-2